MLTTATSPPRPDLSVRRARLAVANLFAVNALVLGSIVPWLPGIKSDLGLSNTALGTAIAVGPIAGIVFGSAAGAVIARLGSARSATVGAVIQLAALPVIALAPRWWVLAVGILIAGGVDTLTDAAMNAHALRVQRRYGRTIISSFHAVWSSGAVVGGLLGSAAVAVGVPRVVHLGGMAVLLGVVLLAGSRWLLPGADAEERPEEAEQVAAGAPDRGLTQALRAAPVALLGVGVLLIAAGMVEDAAATWAALHLRGSVGASAFVAGLGFVATQGLQVVGRATGDRVVDRFGARRVATSGALLASAAMVLAALGPTPGLVILGFGLAGLGVATLFPLGLAAAGEIPGVRSGDGIALVSVVARAGFLLGPPVIGIVADAVDLRRALLVVAVMGVAGTVAARNLPSGDAQA